MKNIITILLLSSLFISCHKVPITGRRQMNLLSENTLIGMSLNNYDQFLSQNPKLPNSDPRTKRVKNICAKLQASVIKYMKEEHMSNKIKGFQWEFNVVEDNAVNAWCMPGGKVVVYTGLLPVAQTDAGIAAVIGHEMAHAIARHGNERMSQQMLTTLGGIGLGVAMRNKPGEMQNIFLSSYGAASTLGILKYSRTHESEADKMGLIFMSIAGYNPTAAMDFWTRMSQTGGASVPEFMSTHPSHQTRINDIKAFLPEAMNYYNANK